MKPNDYPASPAIERLYMELDRVKAMTDEEVCRAYNADSKGEILASIYEDITALEEEYEINNLPDDDGMDYIGLQLSQGMAVVYW